jgi:tRNA dimethylallyltransferase
MITGRFAIIGPTASGKTAAAVALARRHGDVELVSVDAMAVYRHLDIGTAKPSQEERLGLSWHLVDLVDPNEEYSVARFQQDFSVAQAAINDRGHRTILVGGTGLYHRAAIDGLEFAGRYEEIARELGAQALEPDGLPKLYERLCELDPIAASKMNPSNARRIVRALEVSLGSGRPFSSFGLGMTNYPSAEVTIVGFGIARDILATRIEHRLDLQLANGFIEEVDRVHQLFGGLSKTAGQALGYRELIGYLDGQMSLGAARELIISRTKRFARRQEAWFRRDPRVIWLDALDSDLVDQLDGLYRSCAQSVDI